MSLILWAHIRSFWLKSFEKLQIFDIQAHLAFEKAAKAAKRQLFIDYQANQLHTALHLIPAKLITWNDERSLMIHINGAAWTGQEANRTSLGALQKCSNHKVDLEKIPWYLIKANDLSRIMSTSTCRVTTESCRVLVKQTAAYSPFLATLWTEFNRNELLSPEIAWNLIGHMWRAGKRPREKNNVDSLGLYTLKGPQADPSISTGNMDFACSSLKFFAEILALRRRTREIHLLMKSGSFNLFILFSY